jgi:hypothetical protein
LIHQRNLLLLLLLQHVKKNFVPRNMARESRKFAGDHSVVFASFDFSRLLEPVTDRNDRT